MERTSQCCMQEQAQPYCHSWKYWGKIRNHISFWHHLWYNFFFVYFYVFDFRCKIYIWNDRRTTECFEPRFDAIHFHCFVINAICQFMRGSEKRIITKQRTTFDLITDIIYWALINCGRQIVLFIWCHCSPLTRCQRTNKNWRRKEIDLYL